jgi:putative pyruvate formate lyase activating enzyme
VEETFKPGQVVFSLMSQFTPPPPAEKVPELNRPLSKWEHDEAIGYLRTPPITDGFYQELESVGAEFIPKFDLTGI